jgi:hypothetical protein
MKVLETDLFEIESYLPVFIGFYDTIFQPIEENYIEDGYNYDDYDFDYQKYYIDVSIQCTKAIEKQLSDFNIKIEFQELVSPKFYNYENDSIYVKYILNSESYDKVFQYLIENKKNFGAYLENRYTNHDGFISFYFNDADNWLNYLKDKFKLMHTFGSVLDFILNNEGYNYDELYLDVYDKVFLDYKLKTK